jgi:HEAT repeat protein
MIVAIAVSVAPLYAQQTSRPTVSLEGVNSVPRVVNGDLTQSALNGSLGSAMSDMERSAASPIWAGYAIPGVVLKSGAMCCSRETECRLESGSYRTSDSNFTGNVQTVFDLSVFVRFERGQVTRVRAINSDCVIDASGTSVRWLTGVTSAESVAYLLSLVSRDGSRAFSSAAIAAISFHGAAGDPALEKLVSTGQPEQTREQAAFWIATESSTHGLDVLRKLAREDMDERFRRYLTFAFSTASDDSAVQDLIRMAHDDRAPSVRGQALFWMAQKAGSKIAADIAASVENDPDTEVKKRAVFALTQIPNGEGVPKLIEVARTNRNGAVRKQAVFWLGQSHDPRALSFLQDVLTH